MSCGFKRWCHCLLNQLEIHYRPAVVLWKRCIPPRRQKEQLVLRPWAERVSLESLSRPCDFKHTTKKNNIFHQSAERMHKHVRTTCGGRRNKSQSVAHFKPEDFKPEHKTVQKLVVPCCDLFCSVFCSQHLIIVTHLVSQLWWATNIEILSPPCQVSSEKIKQPLSLVC